MYYGQWIKMMGGQIEGMQEVLESLKAQGYHLYGLTNWSAETFPLISGRYPIFSLLEGYVVSGVEKCMKPQEKIYRILLERYGLKAEESIFIDDNPANIEGGKAVGIDGIVFQTVEQLKEELERIFVKQEAYNSLMVTIVSFGFKYGIPLEADLVFDVRFLPNPFYIEGMKHLTGNDAPVRDYVMGFEEAGQFLDKLEDMIRFLIPNYIKEGKYRLVIGIGCTGGKHRSVTLANALYERMKDKGDYGLTVVHKDIKVGV